jgi:hypothetical protein
MSVTCTRNLRATSFLYNIRSGRKKKNKKKGGREEEKKRKQNIKHKGWRESNYGTT